MDELKCVLSATGQAHLLTFLPELTDDDRKELIAQLQSINLTKSVRLFQKAMDSISSPQTPIDDKIQPVPISQMASDSDTSDAIRMEYYKEGLKQIAHGSVCVVLLAGGQGTRLGSAQPKAIYSVGLPSGKTLIQIQAERIQRLQRLAYEHCQIAGHITWYIMTSKATHSTTDEYLRSNNYFGLDATNVILFNQDLSPCFDFNGQILMETKKSIALAPNGNGGVYKAIYENGILCDMAKRRVQFVHMYCVDNILVKVADPTFLGYCVRRNADCGVKVVQKLCATEPVGIVCQVDGQYRVVEYSEINAKTAEQLNPDGQLRFNAGNICNHFFTTDFLRTIQQQCDGDLKLHVAKKKIPSVSLSDGGFVKPTQPNGIKIETFVFDVFEYSKNFVVWNVQRNHEFSPVKNSNEAGIDCPLTAREDLLALHRQYIENAGGTVLQGKTVEISPLLSYAGENLKKHVNGVCFADDKILDEHDETK